jgi:hypothetical protein
MYNHQDGFARGLQICADMLEHLDVDESMVLPVGRRGPQKNAVLRIISQLAGDNKPGEIEGFCAALTEICAFADEQGDYFRQFSALAHRDDLQELLYPVRGSNVIRLAPRTEPPHV